MTRHHRRELQNLRSGSSAGGSNLITYTTTATAGPIDNDSDDDNTGSMYHSGAPTAPDSPFCFSVFE